MASFGGNDASKKEVEGFYDAWYNFDSWRSFEWHDKEANEGSDSYVPHIPILHHAPC
jgi:DnaJ family protein C protein 2